MKFVGGVELYNKGQKVKCNQLIIAFFEKYFTCLPSALVKLGFSSLLPLNMVDQKRHTKERDYIW